MNKFAKWQAAGVALAVLLAAAPRDASASDVSLNIKSSVSPLCVGATYSTASCKVIRFELNIPTVQTLNSTGQVTTGGNVATTGGNFGSFLVETFTLQNSGVAGFSFAGLKGIFTTGMVNITGDWVNLNLATTSFSADNLTPLGEGTPLYFDIEMSSSLTVAQITSMDYAATGSSKETGTGSRDATFSTVGSVTPEPVSMTLLGTGLLGLAGARRRKKQNQA